MNNPYVKTLEPVWRDTKDVWVNEEKLQELIKIMKQKKENRELEVPAWDTPNIQPPMDCGLKDWIDFVCWTNTVNFAFTNFDKPWNKFIIEYPTRTQWKGALAMEASFMRAHQDGTPVFDAWYLADISLEEVNRIFRSIDSDHQIPVIERRQEILREVGRILIEKYDGRWLTMFEIADWRAFNSGDGVVEQLVDNFPSFRDVRYYKSYILEFHKRAQLLLMIYYGRAVNSGGRFPLIDDIEDIGPIADYDVPKALHFLGVIEYSRELENAIQSHKIFSANEIEEVENRLAMSYVMKRICDEVKINMAQADYYIWEMGRSSKAPHILVPTTSY